jgi:hypothetical protein
VLVRVELGGEAIRHIRLMLSRYGGLWRSLADRDLESGTVFTNLPQKLSRIPLDFRIGFFPLTEGEPGENRGRAKAVMCALVKSYLSADPKRVALLKQDSLRSNQQYPFALMPPVGCVWRAAEEDPPQFAREIYAYLPGGETRLSEVKYFLELGDFWSRTCALTLTQDLWLASGMEVDTTLFNECAQRTQHILLNAFDGEATLVWSADKVSHDRLERGLALADL